MFPGYRLSPICSNSIYRVAVTMGNLSTAIGSIDLSVNDEAVASSWLSGRPEYQMLDRTTTGW